MPIVARLLLVAIVVCFAAAMLLVGTGMATRAVAELGKGVSGVVGKLSATPGATALSSGDATSPKLDAPDNGGFTNKPTVTISGSIPADAARKPGYEVRIFAVDARGGRKQVATLPVGAIVQFSAPNIPLTAGLNTFVATLASNGVNGPASAPITYTLDTTPPPLTITAPSNNQTIVGSSVTVAGKTDPGADVNVVGSLSSNGGEGDTAGTDGLFKIKVSLTTGSNVLTVTSTDQAGNQTTKVVTVRRSLGRLSAKLTASPNKINVANPTPLVLTVVATASDGSPLAGAQVVFTVEIRGLGPIVSNTTSPIVTDTLGRASFRTVITGADVGTGTATVLVSTQNDGDVQGATTITTYK